MSDIAEIIRRVVAEQFPSRRLRDDFELKRDLGADELDLVEIALELEIKFDMELPVGITKEWRTIGDIVRTVEALGETNNHVH